MSAPQTREPVPGRRARHEALMREALALASTAPLAGPAMTYRPMTSRSARSSSRPTARGSGPGATNARPRATRPPTPRSVALRAAAAAAGSWRLDGATLVVTLEPCTMCAGALVLARVATLVFGAWEPKTGAVGSLWDVVRDPRLNHRPEVYPGVLADECAALMRDFFSPRRARADDPAG